MSAIQLREVFGFGYAVGVQRKEDACFLFSQVQPFKNGIAHLLRPVCTKTERKGDYRFKAVNLHAALVGQADGTLFSYSFQTPLLQRAFIPTLMVGAVTPNRSQSSHSLMAVACISVGRATLPYSSMLMMFLFIYYAIGVFPND